MAGLRPKRIKPAGYHRVGFLAPGIRFTGELVDLSETGVLVRCCQNVALDTMGRLGIAMGNEILRSVAIVRRNVPGVGVAFRMSHMTPHDRELLRHFLFRNGQNSPA